MNDGIPCPSPKQVDKKALKNVNLCQAWTRRLPTNTTIPKRANYWKYRKAKLEKKKRVGWRHYPTNQSGHPVDQKMQYGFWDRGSQ